MLFEIQQHGKLLGIVGAARKAKQYVLGNPLIAIQMTRHDIRASLYAPLRMIVYEIEGHAVRAEYDLPSSLFGQFGNRRSNRRSKITGFKTRKRNLQSRSRCVAPAVAGTRPGPRRKRRSPDRRLCLPTKTLTHSESMHYASAHPSNIIPKSKNPVPPHPPCFAMYVLIKDL